MTALQEIRSYAKIALIGQALEAHEVNHAADKVKALEDASDLADDISLIIERMNQKALNEGYAIHVIESIEAEMKEKYMTVFNDKKSRQIIQEITKNDINEILEYFSIEVQ